MGMPIGGAMPAPIVSLVKRDLTTGFGGFW
jgi:hypothetical protein